MEDYQSKYTGEQVEELLDMVANGEVGGGIETETDPIFSASPAASITEAKMVEWDGKQDTIADLATIRSGAEKGATALQSVPSEYGTKAWVTEQARDIANDAVGDFEAVAVEPLAVELSTLREDFDTLVSGDTTTAIKTFNEVIAFLDGLTDTQDLESIIASIEQQIAGKMDNVTLAKVATSGSYNDLSNKPTIPSAVTESTVSGWGFTKNTGTYSKPSGGIPKSDLSSDIQSSLTKADNALPKDGKAGSAVTADTATRSTYADCDGEGYGIKDTYAKKTSLATVATSGSYNDLSDKPIVSHGSLMFVEVNGIADDYAYYALPTSATNFADEDDVFVTRNTLKTINGESLFGRGDITISGGSSGGDSYSGNYPIEEITKKTFIKLSPNVYTRQNSIITTSLGHELTFAEPTNTSIVNEYIYEFKCGSDSAGLTLPLFCEWANDDIPVFKSGYTYVISIIHGIAAYIQAKTPSADTNEPA